MRTLSLTFALLAVGGTTLAQPSSFPPDEDYIAIRCAGAVSADGSGDAPQGHRDIVGMGADASASYAVDATHLYLRVRLADSPIGVGGNAPFKSFGWSWGLDVDNDGEFEAFVVLDGNGGPVGDNLSVVDQDPDNGMTSDVLLQPVGPMTDSYATAAMAETNIGMQGGDWFLTVAVPLSTLETFGVSGTFYCYPGSSSNSTGIDTDWACFDGTPGSILDVPVEPVAVSCGDGMLDMGETCDDGDTESGDGCSSSCLTEPGFSCTGEPSTCEIDTDLDDDGVPDDADGDIDGDGIQNAAEGSGDTDGDGLPNDRDTDSDGDGVPDAVEGNDANADGVADLVASGRDDDGDGVDDAFDTDEGGMEPSLQDNDMDGTPDFQDADDDGDGIDTRVECTDASACIDTDGDGTADYLDTDDDGDGIPTLDERLASDALAPPTDDVDADGLPNWLDDDSNGDGVPDGDQQADANGDGVPDYLESDLPPPMPGLAGGACSASGAAGGAPWLSPPAPTPTLTPTGPLVTPTSRRRPMRLAQPRSCVALAMLALAMPGLTEAQADDPAQFTQQASTDKPDEVLDWNLSAGGVFASGNTRAWTLNAGTAFKLIRGRHGLSLNWALAYGRADLTPTDDTTDYQDTVRNSNARVRYDLYLTRNDALFAAVAHRWDTFAGLDTRLQGQVGYLRNLIAESDHRLWGEVGYDITWDNFDPDPLLDPDDPTIVLDGTQVVHAARAYVGYDNKLNENVHFTAGVEGLFNLQEGRDVRVNFDAALQATLVGSLSLELKFKMLFDNVPVPGRVETDTLTTVNLVYTLVHADAPTAEGGAE